MIWKIGGTSFYLVSGLVLVIGVALLLPTAFQPAYEHCVTPMENPEQEVGFHQYTNLTVEGQQAFLESLNSPEACTVVRGEGNKPADFTYYDYSEPGTGIYVIQYENDTYRLESERKQRDNWFGLGLVLGAIAGTVLVGAGLYQLIKNRLKVSRTTLDGESRSLRDRIVLQSPAAYGLLLGVCLVGLGLLAWLALRPRIRYLGVFFSLFSIACALLAIPIAVVARHVIDPDERVVPVLPNFLSWVVALAIAGGIVGLSVGSQHPVLVVGIPLAAAVTFWLITPYAVGALAASRDDVSFDRVLSAWPITNVAGLLLFLLPFYGGLSLSTSVITAPEPLRTVLFGVVSVVVFGGPTALAYWFDEGEGHE